MCDPTPGLGDVLQYLRNDHEDFVREVINGQYSIWFGSGVSLGRVPGVEDLIAKLLVRLFESSDDPSDPDCPYTKALMEVLATVRTDTEDYAERHPEDWDDLEAIARQLSSRYAAVLGTRIFRNGRTPLLAYWDVLKVQEIIPDPALSPGAAFGRA